MTREEILSHVDHTLLKPEATWPQIQTLCDEAIANHTASICINTCYVRQAVEYMAGRIPVCCVVGFPLGAMDTASKAFEAKTAIENGAAEVDMVINIGRLKNKEYDAVREDIRAVKQAVGDKVLKVIIETCLLTDEEKEKMCDIVCEAGADYIKTSTGFSTAGANFHDVELMVKGVHGRCKVKAAGGISTVEDMETFLALGADRLGTSRAVKLLTSGEAIDLSAKKAIINNISAEQNQSARGGCSGSSGFPKGRCTNCCAAALFDAKPCKRGAAGYIIQTDTV